MFTVVIQALTDSSQELQQCIRSLNGQIQEVEHLISSIRRISDFDEVIHSLRRRLEDMNTERRKLIDMLTTLNQIQRMYMQCERNITDYGDQVRQVNYYRSMDVIHLDYVKKSMSGYHIR